MTTLLNNSIFIMVEAEVAPGKFDQFKEIISRIVLGSILPFLLLSIHAEAQYCTPDTRFTEAAYFALSDLTSVTNVVYGNATGWEGNPQDLLMDIWYPSGTNETLSVRPFILLIHGGGFQTGNKEQMSIECRRFAQSGYVAATMSYRLGWNDSDSLDGDFVAAYRAQQDAHAALRYIVEHAKTYGIDTTWMFIGGISAGAGTSLNTVFVNEAEWEAVIPGIVSRWGHLNASGNNLTHPFDIKAVYNDCGSTCETAIKPEDMVPIISFHGFLDGIVPIGSSPRGLAGSAVIHQSLLANGVCSELTVDSLGYHCPHPRNFRVARAACFFKSILCNACSSNYFTEEIPADCSKTIVGLTDLDTKERHFQIYPNPVTHQFAVSGELDLLQIEIANPAGQRFQTILPNGNLHTVDISALPAGLYFVKMKRLNGESFEIQKIIKQ